MSDLSEDNIQKQIEAKRRRLEELKQRRLQRQLKQEDGGSSATAASASPSASSPTSALTASTSSPLGASPRPGSASSLHSSSSLHQLRPSASDDILDVVNSLIISSPAPAQSALSSSAPSALLSPAVPAASAAPPPRPVLSVASQAGVSIASVEVVHYDVGTQTSESWLVEEALEEERKDGGGKVVKEGKKAGKGKGGAAARGGGGWDEEDEELLIKERDMLRRRETELMTTIAEMKSEAERKAREEAEGSRVRAMREGEAEQLLKRSDFLDFFSRSSMLMERALAERQRNRYDFTVDYADDSDADDGSGRLDVPLIHRLSFDDPNRSLSRPVSAMDWNPKHPELMLAAYAATDDDDALSMAASTAAFAPLAASASASSLSSAPGCVLLWNLHLTSRPEYCFTADSSVLCCAFHPTQATLIIGSTASGQLLLWDTRAKSSAVNRTSLAASHSFPVFAFKHWGGAVVSVSSDGHVCHWQEENWHSPSVSYALGRDLSVSCLDIHGGVMYIGSDDGKLYKSRMHADGEHLFDSVRAHDAPVSSLSFQPSSASAAAAASVPLYLTSSYDWTVKLFTQHSPTPLASFESSRDYCYDAAWHPTHPGLFVSGDSTGKLDLWRLGGKAAGTAGGGGAGGGEGGTGGLGEESSAVVGKGWEVPRFSTVVGDAQTAAKGGGEGGSAETGSNAAPADAATGRASALSKLRWHGDGSVLSVGNSRGVVSVWELNKETAECSREEQEHFFDYVNKLAAQGGRATPTVNTQLA